MAAIVSLTKEEMVVMEAMDLKVAEKADLVVLAPKDGALMVKMVAKQSNNVFRNTK